MATARAQLTPTTDQTPAVVEVSKELSGPHWVPRFPGVNTLDELQEPFQTCFASFFSSMKTAGIGIRITAIYRPPQRSYLMHFAKRITMGWKGYPQLDPSEVPEFVPRGTDSGVEIEWMHKDVKGKPDIKASRRAAQQMVESYGIQGNPVAPPYASRHNMRPSTAVDLSMATIQIPKDCKILDKTGKKVSINSKEDLYPVAQTYGVRKLLSDLPHWSDDGH